PTSFPATEAPPTPQATTPAGPHTQTRIPAATNGATKSTRYDATRSPQWASSASLVARPSSTVPGSSQWAERGRAQPAGPLGGVERSSDWSVSPGRPPGPAVALGRPSGPDSDSGRSVVLRSSPSVTRRPTARGPGAAVGPPRPCRSAENVAAGRGPETARQSR